MVAGENPSQTSDEDLVEAAQPNALLQRVDALCEARRWEDLIRLAESCRQAVERGKQLWPIAEHVDYRLALEGPPERAAAVLTPAAGRFALGPLTEVAASTHTFDSLAPHLDSPLVAGVVAAERVVRGDDLTGVAGAHPEVMELPLRTLEWEPRYAVATYRADKVTAPEPEMPAPRKPLTARPGEVLDDPELVRRLADLASTWVTGSNGVADAAVVQGGVAEAIGAAGGTDVLVGRLTPAGAMALMAWAAASGGAHGRRNGAAAGRSAAWWAAAGLCELEWPPDPGELGYELEKLRWYRWEPRRPVGGWRLFLAVEDLQHGWAAALAAEDRD